GHPLGDDGRTDHGRHDEHVVADADFAIRARVAEERRSGCHHIPCGLTSGDRRTACKSPRPRALATLCVCTWVPAAIGDEAVPIGLPYLTTTAPAAMSHNAILWPRGIASTEVSRTAPASTVCPASIDSSAVATLSPAFTTIAAITGSPRSRGIHRRRQSTVR